MKWQFFRYIYQLIANRLNFNICFHVSYGGPSTSFLQYEPLKNDVTIFDPFSGLKMHFRHFPTRGGGGGLVCKNEKLNCFDIHCVVEASSFSLNHNMTLEINAPLICPPHFQFFEKFCIFSLVLFQPKFLALEAQIFIPKTPHFSRKIHSLDTTFGNLCGTHPPKIKLSAFPWGWALQIVPVLKCTQWLAYPS